jgi:hypothetical protein
VIGDREKGNKGEKLKRVKKIREEVSNQARGAGLSHLVARRTFFLPRASPPKILGIVRGLLTNIKSRNLHSIARNY